MEHYIEIPDTEEYPRFRRLNSSRIRCFLSVATMFMGFSLFAVREHTRSRVAMNLWSWGQVWGGIVKHTDHFEHQMGQGIDSLKNTSQATAFEHSISESAQRAENESRSISSGMTSIVEKVQNSSAAKDTEHSVSHMAHEVASGTQSGIRQVRNNSLVKSTERAFGDAASWTASAATNSSAAKDTEHSVSHMAHEVASGTQSGIRQVQNNSLVKSTERAFGDAASWTASAATKASSQVKKDLGHLGKAVNNYTFTIDPTCLVAMEVGSGVIALTAAPPLFLAILDSLGFTEVGVAADSLAALFQSTIGDVDKGSLFAELQSAAARGEAAGKAAELTTLTVKGVSGVGAFYFCKAIESLARSKWQ